ncbi:hypothetical protein K3495_g5949 [Podosphaera aphanis]|nr:hypothetical protein K3495_g5949 [Podosphaera aphanis]
MEDPESLPDVYKIVRWQNAAPRHQSPPLRSDNDTSEVVNDPLSKALLFYRSLLCRHLETSELPIDTPTVPPRNIPWEVITNPKVYTATCQAKFTTPGEDELTTHTLRLAWPILVDRTINLFNHCMKLGFHPSAFQKAVVTILPKTEKRDRSLPISYRLIALLSCLGKVLERLIARRISCWALKSEILARDQCRAVRQRSAIDLTIALLSVGRFGYADDAAFFSSDKTLKDCQLKLQRQLNLSLEWAEDNGIIYDTRKTELIYFRKKRKLVDLPLRVDNHIIPAKDLIKWLGIDFDKKLCFKEHMRLACQRSRVVPDHVRRLCNITRGTSPSLLRQAIQGWAFATLSYGAETWYGPQISQWALNQVQTAMNRVARAVLPIYKTFPTAALMRETGWAPATIWLDRILDRLAVRVAASDPSHPLRHRWNSSKFSWIRRRQALEVSSYTFRPLWSKINRNMGAQNIGASGRARGFEVFRRWSQLRSPLDLTSFSDGSLDKDGKAEADFCVYRGSQEILFGRIPLGHTAQVYDAEIAGAVAGLRAACSHFMARFATNVAVCLDNEEAAIRLHTRCPTP